MRLQGAVPVRPRLRVRRRVLSESHHVGHLVRGLVLTHLLLTLSNKQSSLVQYTTFSQCEMERVNFQVQVNHCVYTLWVAVSILMGIVCSLSRQQ